MHQSVSPKSQARATMGTETIQKFQKESHDWAGEGQVSKGDEENSQKSKILMLIIRPDKISLFSYCQYRV